MAKMTATAYSYTRFSTPEQSEGTSKERQDASVAAWLKANPSYELNSSLNFHDAGVSAFRGRNAKVGKLAAFLKLIEQGKVAPGSVLLVEEWSRFSRQNPYDGAPVSRQIFDAGVGIVDLRNRIRYDATTMRDQVIRIRLDLEWERAHRESEEKSIRMRSAWTSKRQKAAQGIPMTRTCPAWLRLVNSKYEVIAQRAATIQLLFEMKASGMGSETIARKLNGMPDAWHPKEHHLNKRGGWWPSYIEKIIRNRSVIGEFSSAKLSEPIMDYFPAVVPRDLFNRVQARIARNAAIPGHGASNMNGAINNIFGGVTRCARCGGTMAFVNKGQRRPTSVTPSQYLVCEKARRGLGCSKRTVRYDNLEGLLLRLCRGLNPADLLSNEAERSREVLRRQALEGELVQLDKRRNILMRLRGYVETEVSLRDLAAELDQIARRRAKLEREVADFSRDQSITAEAVAEHLQSVDDLITRMQQLKGAERSALRRRLRSALHSLIERLDINPSQHECKLTVTFRDGAALRLVLDERGALRLADDGTRLYWIDENGVVDVDPIADPSTEAEQLERQRRVNALVAKALKRQRVKDQMDL